MTLRTPLLTETVEPRGLTAAYWLGPELMLGLAPLEGHPLVGGRWTLTTSADIDGVQLRINTFPADPFAGDTDVCVADVDQSVEPDEVCIAPPNLTGLTLADGFDEDVFLVPGPLGGGVLPGQTLVVTVTGPPGASLRVEVRPFRAARSLAGAVEADGSWRLEWEVPDELVGRYVSLHVSAAGSLDSAAAYAYELSWVD